MLQLAFLTSVCFRDLSVLVSFIYLIFNQAQGGCFMVYLLAPPLTHPLTSAHSAAVNGLLAPPPPYVRVILLPQAGDLAVELQVT